MEITLHDTNKPIDGEAILDFIHDVAETLESSGYSLDKVFLEGDHWLAFKSCPAIREYCDFRPPQSMYGIKLFDDIFVERKML